MNRAALLLIGGAVIAAAACSAEEVVVATLPVDAGPPARRCASNDDCSGNQYCAKMTCSDMQGACYDRPAFCTDPIASPSCGCDGINYWNDCWRQFAGVNLYAPGECVTGAAMCSDPMGADCPSPLASCARLLGLDVPCTANAMGICWVLPAECPDAGPQEMWGQCFASGTCEDTCTAIRNGQPHQPRRSCP